MSIWNSKRAAPELPETPQQEQQPAQSTSSVTKEEFDGLKQLLLNLQNTVATATQFNPVAADQSAHNEPVVQTPTFLEVTDEQLEQAFNDGDWKEYNKLQKAREQKKDWETSQRIQALENTGLNAIAGLVKETTKGKLKHYDRFSKEVEQVLANMPTQQRILPNAVEIAYSFVVGQHQEELEAEAVERAVQVARTPAKANTPGSTSRILDTQEASHDNQVAPPSSEAQEALSYQGHDADGFAKRLGYKSWSDYMQRTTKHQQENEQWWTASVQSKIPLKHLA